MSNLSCSQPNSRSCLTCRRRKLKCDKQSPCSSCKKAHFDCSYQALKLTQRKKRSDSNAALKARLETLEHLVQDLNANAVKESGNQKLSLHILTDGNLKTSKRELGRLVVEEGESRYIENSFWVALSNEVGSHTIFGDIFYGQFLIDIKVSEIRNIVDEYSDDASDTGSQAYESSPWTGEQGFIYSFNSLVSNITAFHPNSDQISFLWRLFVDNVDPVVRMLHKPSMQTKIDNSRDKVAEVSKPFEALMFAIYFGSITSMTEVQCETTFHEGKDVLLCRYRFAVQQALARARFLNTHNLVTLQAIVIFLVRLILWYYES